MSYQKIPRDDMEALAQKLGSIEEQARGLSNPPMSSLTSLQAQINIIFRRLKAIDQEIQRMKKDAS